MSIVILIINPCSAASETGDCSVPYPSERADILDKPL